MLKGTNDKIVLDFLDCEINIHNFNEILYLLTCPNIHGFEYEGNQYELVKTKNEDKVSIIDMISEENGVCIDYTRTLISIKELVILIKNKIKL